MQSKEKNNIIFVRLYPNEDVNEELINVCKKHNVDTAVVISGIGQLNNAELGYFKGKKDYSLKKYNEPLEILSLTGNICKDKEEYIIHLHAVLGDDKKNALGGHFASGKISITGEIVIIKTEHKAERILNKKTGLRDLFLE